MNEAREVLKKIGVTNEIQEIKDFQKYDYHGTGIETTYTIITEIGEIDFRVIKLSSGKVVSTLDYFDTRYEFNRNVNTLALFE